MTTERTRSPPPSVARPSRHRAHPSSSSSWPPSSSSSLSCSYYPLLNHPRMQPVKPPALSPHTRTFCTHTRTTDTSGNGDNSAGMRPIGAPLKLEVPAILVYPSRERIRCACNGRRDIGCGGGGGRERTGVRGGGKGGPGAR